MSTWTDDELGELLRGSFHDHERPDDAERAQRIARSAYPVRRRPPLGLIAVAASLVAVTGLGMLGARAIRDEGGSASTSAGPAVMGAAGAPRTEAHRLLRAVPLPAGSVRHNHLPAGEHPLTTSGATSDQAEVPSQTAWWTVPLSPLAYAAYVAAHPPAGLTARGHARSVTPVQGAGSPSGALVYEQDFDEAGAKHRGAPSLALIWAATDGGTTVQATARIVR